MPKFQLERTITIAASAASVFSNVKNFRNWAAWSPWLLAEPDCKVDYASDGKRYSWDGDIIGSGKMEVLEYVENEAIHYRLTFFTPFKSTSSVSFFFNESNGETNTRWTMSGSLPFFLFWMKNMMLAGIGMDYDRGLRMLKDQVELGDVPSEMKFGGFETVEGFSYFGKRRDCSLAEISKVMGEDMQQLSASLKKAGVKTVGAPVCFYNKFNVTKGTTRYTLAFPVAATAKCPPGLLWGQQPKLKCYAIHHAGPYRHLGNPWAAGMMHQRAKMFEQDKSNVPFEVYENDACKVAEEDVLTSVYFPIK